MDNFKIIFCFLIILLYNDFCNTGELNKSEDKSSKHICYKKINTTKTLTKSILYNMTITYQTICKQDENYKNCVKTKILPKPRTITEDIIEEKEVEHCCAGYKGKHINGTLVCSPKCNYKCEHGKCIAPNTCECNSGYEMDTLFKCKPKCENCNNGDCIEPGKCKCKNDYIKHSTNGTCMPKCVVSCTNGFCSKPNVCTCFEGYELDYESKFVCNPKCTPSCENGSFCIAPNVCQCEEGYEKSSNGNCLPICDSCSNGQCITPNVCKCNSGYEEKESTINGHLMIRCEPICDKPCTNGYCSAPNVCTCDKYYEINRSDNFTCDPICNPPCKNGRCVAPYKCKCNPDYYHFDSNTCYECNKDICTIGDCIIPKECPCPKTHIYNESSGYCEVDKNISCLNKCTNSNCIVNKCKCWPGYNKVNTTTCEPICPLGCENGKCIKPNTCSCNPGYIPHKERNNICYPQCSSDCGIGGSCTSPNVCECYEHYKLNDTNQCTPICDSCKNGICVSPGICKCNGGYKRIYEIGEYTSRYKCQPICTQQCQNGFCGAPETCYCLTGYKKNPVYPHICDPICENSCENGRCISPDVCKCNAGFYMNDTFKRCLLCNQTCMSDEDKCIVPEECPCPNGTIYNKVLSLCEKLYNEKSCEEECINSDCIQNECKCWKGYKMSEIYLNQCDPICSTIYEGGCLNGKCIRPGVCACDEGFILDKYNNYKCVLKLFYINTSTSLIYPTNTPSNERSPSVTPNEIDNNNKISNSYDKSNILNYDEHMSMDQPLENSKYKAEINAGFLVMGVFAAIMLIIGSITIYRKYGKSKSVDEPSAKVTEHETFFPSAYFIVDNRGDDFDFIAEDCDIKLNV